MTDEQPRMLVVVDSDATSHAPLGIAQQYASETVVLRSWSAEAPYEAAEVRASNSAEPTIPEALELAAQRGISWIGLRRSFIPAQELLGELLLATAQHTADATPGFAVFLADGDPKPFKHILAIFDRSHGPMSGLLAYASVAVADVYDAQLDILVVGSKDENPHTEDTFSALAISREQELYEAAVNRAREHNVRVNWLTAASVTELWPMIADQLSQHDYDLVVDDLGDVSLARMRQRGAIETALAKGSAGEVPLHLLTDTSLPVLLVIDEIRLQWAPERLLKAGAIAAVALGVMGSPVAVAAAAPAPVLSVEAKRDPATELVADLEKALDLADDEGDEAEEKAAEQRAADAAGSSRGATTGAREAAQAGDPVSIPSPQPATTQYQVGTQIGELPGATQPGVAVSASSVIPSSLPATPTSTEATSTAGTKEASGEQSKSSTAKQRKKQRQAAAEDTSRKARSTSKPAITAPKGGATPAQVSRAMRETASDRAALAKAKTQKDTTEKRIADLKDEIADVEQAGMVALANVEAAVASHEEAEAFAQQKLEASAGVNKIIPGIGPSEEEVDTALAAEAAAADRLDEAVETGEEVLDDLAGAEKGLARQKDKLADRRVDVEEAKADYEYSAKKASVFQASLRATKQSPVAKGRYNITARFGDAGGHWSSGHHTGLDFAAPSGTPVQAAASGKVVSSGYAGAYGNRVVIQHGSGVETTYNHLSSISVSPGQKVSTGQRIGRVGSTGNSTGPHLHFEVTKGGQFVNPASWLGM